MKHTVTLSNGATVPALGQGTWYLGDAPETYAREVDALRAGIEAGMTLIDTAEDCAAIDRAFPPPTRKEPLHIE